MKIKITKQIIEIDGRDFEVEAEIKLKEIVKKEQEEIF